MAAEHTVHVDVVEDRAAELIRTAGEVLAFVENDQLASFSPALGKR